MLEAPKTEFVARARHELSSEYGVSLPKGYRVEEERGIITVSGTVKHRDMYDANISIEPDGLPGKRIYFVDFSGRRLFANSGRWSRVRVVYRVIFRKPPLGKREYHNQVLELTPIE